LKSNEVTLAVQNDLLATLKWIRKEAEKSDGMCQACIEEQKNESSTEPKENEPKSKDKTKKMKSKKAS